MMVGKESGVCVWEREVAILAKVTRDSFTEKSGTFWGEWPVQERRFGGLC